jgi:hypothetical protein
LAAAGGFSITLATGSSLTVEGSIGTREINAEYTNTTVLQAQQGVFDQLASKVISAINAAIETITAARMELIGYGWNYIRTSGKWLQDNVNGWISASRGDNNSFFQEFRASNGNALVWELKAGGPDMGGCFYVLQVRDASGVDRLVIDPQNGIYKLRGRIEADEGYFSGALNAATGSFSGALNGATGSFSGSMTAGAVNAVNRINIGNEQITIMRSVEGSAITYAPSSMAAGESVLCTILAGFCVKGFPGGQWTSSAGGGTSGWAMPGTAGTATVLINGVQVKSFPFFAEGTGWVAFTLMHLASITKGDIITISVTGTSFHPTGGSGSLASVSANATYLESSWIVVQGCAR